MSGAALALLVAAGAVLVGSVALLIAAVLRGRRASRLAEQRMHGRAAALHMQAAVLAMGATAGGLTATLLAQISVAVAA